MPVAEEEIIYGKHPIEEALRGGRVKRIWALDKDAGNVRKDVLELAGSMKIRIDLVTRRYLDDKMGRANHQGIIAKIEPFEYSELGDILEGNSRPLLILDKLKDPGNLGNIIRTSAAFATGGIIIPKDRAVGITPTVEKAASGTAAFVPITRVTNLARAFDEIKDAGYWIYGTDAESGTDIDEAKLSGKVAIALGGEAKGLSRILKEKCDGLVKIPISGNVESLNVATAGAICLYEIARINGWSFGD